MQGSSAQPAAIARTAACRTGGCGWRRQGCDALTVDCAAGGSAVTLTRVLSG